jgi:hypothetical protein
MSDWTSFKKDKIVADAWRSYLLTEEVAPGATSPAGEDGVYVAQDPKNLDQLPRFLHNLLIGTLGNLTWKPLTGEEVGTILAALRDDFKTVGYNVLDSEWIDKGIATLEEIAGAPVPLPKTLEAIAQLDADQQKGAQEVLSVHFKESGIQVDMQATTPSGPQPPTREKPAVVGPAGGEVPIGGDETEKPKSWTAEDLPDSLDDAEKQKILGMIEFDKDNLDNIDLLLTLGSIVPGGFGCIVGVVNSAFNVARAEYMWGVFDFIFAMPPICAISMAGEAASGGKLIFKLIAKLGPKAPKVLKSVGKTWIKGELAVTKYMKTAGRLEKVALKVLDDIEKLLSKILGKNVSRGIVVKYAEMLINALKSKKKKKQIGAILTILPDELLEHMNEVLNKPATDIWGLPAVNKLDDVLEKWIGIDIIPGELHELTRGPMADLFLYLLDKAGALDEEKRKDIQEKVDAVRKEFNKTKDMSKEERVAHYMEATELGPAEATELGPAIDNLNNYLELKSTIKVYEDIIELLKAHRKNEFDNEEAVEYGLEVIGDLKEATIKKSHILSLINQNKLPEAAKAIMKKFEAIKASLQREKQNLRPRPKFGTFEPHLKNFKTFYELGKGVVEKALGGGDEPEKASKKEKKKEPDQKSSPDEPDVKSMAADLQNKLGTTNENLLRETQIRRWQTIAGIKKSAI